MVVVSVVIGLAVTLVTWVGSGVAPSVPCVDLVLQVSADRTEVLVYVVVTGALGASAAGAGAA